MEDGKIVIKIKCMNVRSSLATVLKKRHRNGFYVLKIEQFDLTDCLDLFEIQMKAGRPFRIGN